MFTAEVGYFSSLASAGTKLEGKVNAWLAEHPGVRVVLVKQSSCGSGLEPPKLFLTVWYEHTEPAAAADSGA